MEITKEKNTKYSADMPRKLYSFFVGYSDSHGVPSFSKFARSIGATLADIEEFLTHEEFRRAYDECNEIRRDYLIDNALCKRLDGSLTKFLLASEFGMGEYKDGSADKDIEFTLRVIDSDEK